MQRIIEYLQTTYTVGQLVFLGIIGAILVIGFFVTLVLAIISSVKNHKKRIAAESDETTELYLIISHLDGKIKALDEKLMASENKTEIFEERAKLKVEKLEYENRLNTLLGDDANSESIAQVKEVTEKKIRRKSRELKVEERAALSLERRQYSKPTAVLVEEDFADEQIGDALAEDVSEKETQENEDISAVWDIVQNENEYKANLLCGDEVLLETPVYTSLSGVKSAILTIVNNLSLDNCAIGVLGEEFYFSVFSGSGKILCKSKTFKTKYLCEEQLEKAKKYAPIASK